MSDNELHLTQPGCRHLRSKGMYITGLLNPAEEDYDHMGDGHCWCNRTQNVIGPDDQLVDRPSCSTTRDCYESLL